MKKIVAILCLIVLIIPSISSAELIKATLIKNKNKVVVISGSKEASQYFSQGYSLMVNNDNFGGVLDPMQPSGVSVNIRQDLVSGSTRSVTTLVVDPMRTLDGHYIEFSDFNSTKVYAKIDQGNNNEELFYFTGITTSTATYTLTGIVWGCNFYNTTCGISANMKRHFSGGIMSLNTDFHFINENFVSLGSNQTITGLKTFYSIPYSTSTPIRNGDVANKKYVDDTSFVGSPNAQYTSKGIIQIATSSEFAVGTRYGSTGATLVVESRAVASSSIAKTMIPATKSNGILSNSFIDNSVSPIGSMVAYASSTPPSGWLACNGSSLSTTTYSSLFAILKYTYGGVVGHSFKLPDLRSRAIVGYGTTTNSYLYNDDTMGATGGATSTLLTANQSGLPSHHHGVPDSDSGTGYTYFAKQSGGTGGTSYLDTTNTGGTSATETHTNMDPYIIMQYIIKY